MLPNLHPVAQKQPSQESHRFVNTHFPSINHCFQTENTSYQIHRESILNQNGVYHFLHLLGKQDRRLYTITFGVNKGHNHLFETGVGHLPHQHGYGQLFDGKEHPQAKSEKQIKEDHHCHNHQH